MLLRTKELLDAADIGKLRPRWDGPFTVMACPSPYAYTLALPRKMRCSPTVKVDRLKPLFERAGAEPAPGPVSDVGQEGEHEVERLLNRRLVRGVLRCLVRRRGHTSADDEWLRAEEQTMSGCARRSWRTALPPPAEELAHCRSWRTAVLARCWRTAVLARCWRTAQRRWRSTTPRPPAAARPAGPTRWLQRHPPLRPRHRRPSCHPPVSG